MRIFPGKFRILKGKCRGGRSWGQPPVVGELMKRKTVKIKAYALLLGLFCLMGAAGRSLANISGDAEYVAAAGQQSVYRLDVAKSRGTIYDCNLTPLTGQTTRLVAAVAPTIEAVGALESVTKGRYRQRLATALEDGKPFVMELDRYLEHDCVDLFSVPRRYQEDQLAPHVVGYLDSTGSGAAGVELAMNDALENHGGEITVYYQVDGLGRAIAGASRMVVDTLEPAGGGVAVTIDAEIQRLAEENAGELGRGAVVVTEVPNCEIRALVSLPDFDPGDIGTAAQGQDSPLINRAFCAYPPGSVFKLATAAAQLESQQKTQEPANSGTTPAESPVGPLFTCNGALNAGGMLFHCFDGTAHGVVDLKAALEKSCNGYFISAARALGGQTVLAMAYNLGLGQRQEFGRGLFSSPGILPEASDLENARALANFSFGQGDLAVTPVQLCGMMNAIAAGGQYSSPKLIAGQVNAQQELSPYQPVTDQTVQAMSPATAKTLRDYLISAAKRGTGSAGAPGNCASGIKTGTSQTGAYEGDKELSHFIYCGFICDKTGAPRYCVTVLRESVAEDKGATARVFRKITEGLAERANQEDEKKAARG